MIIYQFYWGLVQSMVQCATREDADAIRTRCMQDYPGHNCGPITERELSTPANFFIEVSKS